MSNSNGFQTDPYVKRDWGNGTAKGQIRQRLESEVKRTFKGNEVSRDDSEDNPAYLIEQEEGDEVLKFGSDLEAA